MDVMRFTPGRSRTIDLGLGTIAGLALALPVETGSVACPPAQEGRTYCLVQQAWAPAALKLAAAILVVWLLGGLVRRVPGLYRRWRAGERVTRRAHDHGRTAVLADGVLAAASWGIVPEVRPAWRVVRAEAVADVVAPRPEPEPDPVPRGIHALTAAERRERFRRGPRPNLHVLDRDEIRTRRLRLANDPALVVACWSDASGARELPDELPVAAVIA